MNNNDLAKRGEEIARRLNAEARAKTELRHGVTQLREPHAGVRFHSDRFGVDGCEGVADAPRNGWEFTDDIPREPPDDGAREHRGDDEAEATTWEAVDLGPYLRGEIEPVTPSVGAYRTDGQQVLYPGLEHSVIAHTAAGKTWFALACVTAEILAAHPVVYLHFEESTAASTVERLLRIGLPADVIDRLVLFAAPSKPLRHGWLDPLIAMQPTLVIIDGVNEAMVLQGEKIDLEGWSAVRRRLVVPFKENGAAVLECDHLPLSADPLRGDAYGTVHKGNVIDGARFALVRKEMFGRGRRGVSHLYSTKDRPGYLGVAGKPNDKGDVFLGTLVADDSSTAGPDFLTLYAPKGDDNTDKQTVTAAQLADIVHDVISALPDQIVGSQRKLCAQMRQAGHGYRRTAIADAVDDLIVTGRLIEAPGRRGAIGYRAVLTASQDNDS